MQNALKQPCSTQKETDNADVELDANEPEAEAEQDELQIDENLPPIDDEEDKPERAGQIKVYIFTNIVLIRNLRN